MKDVKKLAEELASLTHKETLELVAELESLGFKAAEPQQIVVAPKEEKEVIVEKTSCNILLESLSSEMKLRLKTISLWKNIAGGSLVDNKTLLESAPVVIKTDVPLGEAESIKTQLEELGAKVTLQ